MSADMPVPLLSRLAGFAEGPTLSREAFLSAVELDVMELLNTRAPHREAGRRASPTSLDYGVPDWSAAPADGREVAARVAETLRAFEPRFKGVRVTPEPRGERLFLRVEAVLAGKTAGLLLQCDGGLFAVSPDEEG